MNEKTVKCHFCKHDTESEDILSPDFGVCSSCWLEIERQKLTRESHAEKSHKVH